MTSLLNRFCTGALLVLFAVASWAATVVVQARGGRFETASEIRMFRGSGAATR